ncbi:MAG: antibiotic biosynthesis monooxygenase [Epsilonproteobacteria bacterium]|nr:antibiotic biosynthesis monooxygenase [Campylobacterota bacterium]
MQRRVLFKKSLAYVLLFSTVQGFAKTEQEDKMAVELMITFHVKEEKLESFMALIQDVKKNLPKVDGCRDVEVFQVHDDKYTIRFIETWESIEKHKKHITHVIDSGDWDYISSHLRSDPKSQYYRKL